MDLPVGSGDVHPGDRGGRVSDSVQRVNGHVVRLAPLQVADVTVVEGAEPAITGFDGDILLVRGATGDYRVLLNGSAATRVDGGN